MPIRHLSLYTHIRQVLTVLSTVETVYPTLWSLQQNGSACHLFLIHIFSFIKSKDKMKDSNQSLEQIALKIKSLSDSETLESVVIDMFAREMQSTEYLEEFSQSRRLCIADMLGLLLRIVYA